MIDGTLTLGGNLALVGSTYPQSNKFVTGVKFKGSTGDSKINDSPG